MIKEKITNGDFEFPDEVLEPTWTRECWNEYKHKKMVNLNWVMFQFSQMEIRAKKAEYLLNKLSTNEFTFDTTIDIISTQLNNNIHNE